MKTRLHLAATRTKHRVLCGVQVLKSVPLRSLANQMAYHDKERLATEDAMRIGRLHTHLPGAAKRFTLNHVRADKLRKYTVYW